MADRGKAFELTEMSFLCSQDPENLLGEQGQGLQHKCVQAGGRAEPRDDLQVG